jgi:UDP-N-acetylmuramoylalanine--D-glutamate ligase
MNFDARETALVIGLGRSGQSTVEVLCRRGVTVYATDEKPQRELAGAIAGVRASGGTFVDPGDLNALLPQLTVAVLSPGVPLTNALVRRVQDRNVPVFSEVEVAYRLCRAPIVAVTGTKGKSTTTSLIGHLFRTCGRTVHVGGNIGNPLVREVVDAGPDDWVVAEVSSFQLESIRSFKPRVAVLLNISPDHLDRYYSMDEYAEAKFRIFANQGLHDAFVGNLDDERVSALHWQNGEGRVAARQLWYTMRDRHERATMYLRDGSVLYAPIAGDPRPFEVLRRDEIPLAGEHNVQNVMAALLAALAAGLEPHRLRAGVASFVPMAHRLQPVADIAGVLYVDDSKATNPDSAIAALHAYDRPVVLIAGGKPKNTEFAEMGRAIDRRARTVVLIGEAAAEIARFVESVPVLRAASMEEAVALASGRAVAGDIVLLSPGCASFDMFASAEDRGERFAAAVCAMREAAGAQ